MLLLNITEVKKILKEQSRETLIELIIDGYKTIPQLKEYITVKYANISFENGSTGYKL